jgi:MEMO1 family protein
MSANFRNAIVRPAAVAGYFYPSDPAELRDTVATLLTNASVKSLPSTPRAYIVPHAGYIYSGSTAAAVYAGAAQQRVQVRRVVLIGPSHRVYLDGAAIPNAEVFATPLGGVRVDPELREKALSIAGVVESDHPHRLEHSLEVQLPFLQIALDDFTLMPIVVGQASAAAIATMLEAVCDTEGTLVLASSDLSHYHTYKEAQRIDADTSAAILSRQSTLSPEQACGAVAINGLLYVARTWELQVEELARCNSGDTAGDRDRVVGYGAYALYDAH